MFKLVSFVAARAQTQTIRKNLGSQFVINVRECHILALSDIISSFHWKFCNFDNFWLSDFSMVQIHVIGSQLTEIILLLQRSIQLGTALPVLPAACRPSQMLYGSCHCWLVVVMVPLLLVCVSPSWAAPLWVGCYQVVLLCIEQTGVEVAKMSSLSSASVRSSQIGNTSIAWMATDRQLI